LKSWAGEAPTPGPKPKRSPSFRFYRLLSGFRLLPTFGLGLQTFGTRAAGQISERVVLPLRFACIWMTFALILIALLRAKAGTLAQFGGAGIWGFVFPKGSA